MLAPAGAFADSSFVFYTDTSSLHGMSGYIDLQYEGNAGIGYSTATITGFSTNGSLGGCAVSCLTGGASGDLISTVILDNGALSSWSYNDYDEAITFGTFTEFTVALSGPAGGTANSAFTLMFYNSDYSINWLSSDFDGASAKLTVKPDGTVLPVIYADDEGKFDTTVTNESGPSLVPEPSSFFAVGTGLALLAGYAARNRFSHLAQNR
jgi:hypothetical protein